MRLIDADELCEGRVENDPVRIAAMCAPTIEAVPVVHGWIPCSERLPEETDYPEQRYRILASCSDGIVRNATIKSLRDPEEKHRSMGNEFTYVAWMPLPEPYAEQT